MANTQAQFGFQEYGFLPGFAPDYQLAHFTISSSNATLIGNGDPVCYAAATTGTPFIIQATGALATTQPIIGIFRGCYYVPSGGGTVVWSPYWPGASATNATAYVSNSPGALFKVAALQTAVTSSNIGQAVNFTTGAPATTGAGYSVATIDQSTATSSGTTTSLLPFRIVDLYQGIGNGSDPTTNYNWAIVSFNFQLNRSFVGG